MAAIRGRCWELRLSLFMMRNGTDGLKVSVVSFFGDIFHSSRASSIFPSVTCHITRQLFALRSTSKMHELITRSFQGCSINRIFDFSTYMVLFVLRSALFCSQNAP